MINSDILSRYFKKQCTAAEREEVEVYLNGKDHQLLDQYLAELWTAAGKDPSVVVPPEFQFPVEKRGIIKSSGWLKYAAALVGVLLLSTLVWKLSGVIKTGTLEIAADSQKWKEFTNKEDNVKSLTMADGTRIWLNRNAVISYPSDYNIHSREIKLAGEAYFEVAKHPEKPFRVYTGKIVTTALGTAFNISSYLTTDTAISISLLNGKVSVMQNDSAKASDIRYLTPGMNIRFENNELQRERTDNSSRNTLAWMKHKIAFDSASMKEVCRRLSYHFGVRIVAGNGAGKKRVSGIFKTTDSLKTIIHAITYVHDLKVTDTGNEYVISAR